MKKTYLLILSFLFTFHLSTFAQDIVDEEEDTDEQEIVYDEEETTAPTDSVGIDLPEGLTESVDSLLNLYHVQNNLEMPSDCNFPDVNPSYDTLTYVNRLQQLPTVMEMSHNSVVQQFIDRYANRLRRTVSIMLGAQNFYMPIFEEALESYGLPLELKYLPVIESALNPNAVSRVGATGLWQFMLTTGRQYGLEVNSLVDERRDPIKASHAAARYLRDLYRIFGDWNLVIAAYNCGPNNINKAIHRAGGKTDYWEIYSYLPRETRGYVPAFIAANYIMNYYCEHNICPMQTNLPAQTDTIMLSRDVHFEQIAQVLGMDIRQIRELNPQYRRDIINGATKPSVLKLPVNQVNNFIDHEADIYAYRADELLTKRSTVVIPNDVPQYSSKSHKRGRSRGRGRRTVTVRSGQTLSQIAARNHTTVAKLRRLNGIKGSNIRAGKKLRVR